MDEKKGDNETIEAATANTSSATIAAAAGAAPAMATGQNSMAGVSTPRSNIVSAIFRGDETTTSSKTSNKKIISAMKKNQ